MSKYRTMIRKEWPPEISGFEMCIRDRYSSVESAAEKLVKFVDTIEPDEDLVARYNDRYAQFAKMCIRDRSLGP